MTVSVRVPRQVEFLVDFSDSAGQRLSGDLTELWTARFEDAAPVRSFPSFKKQRNFPGWWWSATVDRLVGFESWLERDHLMQLDFDADVIGMASQPMWLRWQQNNRWRRHAPDYFVRRAAESPLRPAVSGAGNETLRSTSRFSLNGVAVEGSL